MFAVLRPRDVRNCMLEKEVTDIMLNSGIMFMDVDLQKWTAFTSF